MDPPMKSEESETKTISRPTNDESSFVSCASAFGEPFCEKEHGNDTETETETETNIDTVDAANTHALKSVDRPKDLQKTFTAFPNATARTFPLQQARSNYQIHHLQQNTASSSSSSSSGGNTYEIFHSFKSSSKGNNGASTGCTCKRSKCLKLYCQCFAASVLCDDSKCNCITCQNTAGNETQIQEARSSVLYRNPRAFENKFHPHESNAEMVHSNIQMSHAMNGSCFFAASTSNAPNASFVSNGSSGFHGTGTATATSTASGPYPHPHPSTTRVHPHIMLPSMYHPNRAVIQSKHAAAIRHNINDRRDTPVLAHKSGCKCRKSSCVKKYCECYQIGAKCANNCRCIDCHNKPEDAGSSSGGSSSHAGLFVQSMTQPKRPSHPNDVNPSYIHSQYRPFASKIPFVIGHHPYQAAHAKVPPNAHPIPNVTDAPNTCIDTNDDPVQNRTSMNDLKHTKVQTESSKRSRHAVHESEKVKESSMSSFNALSAAAVIAITTNPMDMMAAIAMTELASGNRTTHSSERKKPKPSSILHEEVHHHHHHHHHHKRRHVDNHQNIQKSAKIVQNSSPSVTEIPSMDSSYVSSFGDDSGTGIEAGMSFESSSSSSCVENQPPESNTTKLSMIKLPKSLSFRSICSKCGRPRKEHGERWFGGQCKFDSCGKCGLPAEEHVRLGVKTGWYCSLTESNGAKTSIIDNYMKCIDVLAMTAEFKKNMQRRLE